MVTLSWSALLNWLTLHTIDLEMLEHARLGLLADQRQQMERKIALQVGYFVTGCSPVDSAMLLHAFNLAAYRPPM
jgi:hypothetical protein